MTTQITITTTGNGIVTADGEVLAITHHVIDVDGVDRHIQIAPEFADGPDANGAGELVWRIYVLSKPTANLVGQWPDRPTPDQVRDAIRDNAAWRASIRITNDVVPTEIPANWQTSDRYDG